MLGANVKQEPKDFATVIALIAGWGSLLILLADETHNAWADLYSTAVSLQNVFPKARQRWLILGLGAVCLIAALALDVTKYQGFLYIVGSFFIPLFGILAADYFIVRRRGRPGRGGKAWALVVWVVGIATYHVTSPSTLASIFPRWTDLVPRGLAGIGGSIPSFILPFLIYALLAPKIRKDTSSMEARV
jgi:purine-cytosine permease-like protein